MKKILLFIIVSFLFIPLFSISQTNRFWSGFSSANDNIGDGSNWFNGVNPSSNDNLYFNNTCGACKRNPFSNYGAGSFFNNIIVYNGSGIMTWKGDKTFARIFENNNNGSTFYIDGPISNMTSEDMQINAYGTGGVYITTNSSVDLQNSGNQLKLNGDNPLTFDGPITGSGFIVLYGNSNVNLNAANSTTGTLFITNGTVYANNTTDPLNGSIKLGETSGTNAAKFYIGANLVPIDNALEVRSGSSGTKTIGYSPTSGTGTFNSSSSILLSTSATFDVNTGGTLDIIGGVTGSNGITKTGSGILKFSGTNNNKSYTGLTTISGGQLKISTNQTLGAVTLNSGGTLTVDPSVTLTITGAFTGGGSIINNGKIVLTGPSVFPGNTTTISNMNDLEINRAGGVTLDKNLTVSGQLTLTSGTLSIASNTLTLNGTVTGSATLKGSSTSNLSVGGTGALGTLNFDQTTDGTTNVINNFTMNRTSGTATLGNKMVLLDTYTPTAGVLTSGGNLHLRSTATNTARIAIGTSGYITGDVTVERYISSLNNRAYRQLGSIVTTTSSIRTNWQENGLTPAGYGIHITGSTSGANGLDATFTGSPSLYSLNNAGTAWDPVLNTITPSLNANKGYLIFIRGDRNVNLGSNTSSSNTALRATGSLLTGNQTLSGLTANAYNFITNPFASAIDWFNIYDNGTTTTYGSTAMVYYDPNVGLRGAYVTVQRDGTVSPTAPYTTTPRYLQSGQAFWVKCANTITSLTIREIDKVTNNNQDVFRTNGGTIERLQMSLYYNDAESGRRIADGIATKFGNDYSVAIGAEDATKFSNFDEEVAILRDGQKLSIEGRTLIDQEDTLPIFIAKMKEQAYEWQFDPTNFSAPGLQAYLQDKYLNIETAISLADQTIIPFNITINATSAASDRFRVVFRNITVLPINFTNVKAFEKGNSIQVEWNLGNEQNMKQYEIEKSIDGRTFTKAGMQTARATMNADNYQYLDQQPNIGNNFYRIKAIEKGGTFKYSQVVNVKVGKGNSAITVYPNPVTDNVISLQLINQPKGKYSIRLLNQLGQEVYRKELNHIGGSATETLQLNKKIARGLYNLQVTRERSSTNQKVIVE